MSALFNSFTKLFLAKINKVMHYSSGVELIYNYARFVDLRGDAGLKNKHCIIIQHSLTELVLMFKLLKCR
jgi:hypothetical protein